MQKRSLKIAGHATSVALEPEFWQALEDIARLQKTSLSALIATIDRQKEAAMGRNLASQLRVFVLNSYRNL
ncbi:ribbon-helix-helix domain-containing protein [Candidatus Finniella inopinata]|uniref:Aryl-sulfate sulfotransferase n=1 Tax=Candidatus Finniella inopinata TaxID=1696036 RepID=A0A4Q7DJW7_9PROT|nr:ribbon-helix-helix domain-containing protein [Candidatus Finniella inopinata]RZI46465.1 aryl-sulfate sulfotransferase [Candidatus Finniella inopinata]